jgi:hypothetical protein
MTAGSGILHDEVPTEAFVRSGGRTHGVQLWVNLPAALKMSAPRYQQSGRPTVAVVSGRRRWCGSSLATWTGRAASPHYAHDLTLAQARGALERELQRYGSARRAATRVRSVARQRLLSSARRRSRSGRRSPGRGPPDLECCCSAVCPSVTDRPHGPLLMVRRDRAGARGLQAGRMGAARPGPRHRPVSPLSTARVCPARRRLVRQEEFAISHPVPDAQVRSRRDGRPANLPRECRR